MDHRTQIRHPDHSAVVSDCGLVQFIHSAPAARPSHAEARSAVLLHDFWHSFKLLWKDPLGQVSLAVTTLFWGVGATLRLVVLAWAAFNLNFDLTQATQLTAMSAVGIAVGAAWPANGCNWKVR
jgi:hypothetical protein